ncbi:MAG TPA: tripartite tricarboxylate transporter substrate binding protein [Lacipirellulaceae bacterium]|nr:tripartite tricarboxylate transporter substrate binding protein [Lacipirellulaceae bacterium]
MKLQRRNFLHLAAGAAALPVGSRYAFALDYPTRPVHMIVGFAAGGPTDVAARVIGRWLSERLGQAFVIENRPGAGSNVAAEFVVRAPADGYTLLIVGAPAAINATLYSNLKFNVIRDITPVAGIVRVPEVMVINPLVPAKTVPEFIAYAKANPGKINMATGGPGSVPDAAGELFKFTTGLDLVRVGYRGGGPALIDLIAGQVQVMFETTLVTAAHIRAGQLRALAVTSATRSAALPDVPTLAEFVPGYEATAWFGLGAPKGTPAGIVEKLDKEVNAGLADPGIEEKLADLGGTPMSMRAADFGKLIVDETAKWGKVIRAANIKVQ